MYYSLQQESTDNMRLRLRLRLRITTFPQYPANLFHYHGKQLGRSCPRSVGNRF